jgi:phosphoglucosamine mutase
MNSDPSLMLRTIADEDMTAEKALRIGRMIGRSYKSVCVGSDMSPSSGMIKNALISGLLSAGADVNDAGIAPAPAVALASKGSDCAVMVGEPDELGLISGLRLMNSDGSVFTKEQIRRMVVEERAERPLPGYKGIGKLRRIDSVADEYIKTICERYPMKVDAPVILDCGCGCASVCAPRILASIGADLTTINAQNDPRYVPRPPGVGAHDISGLEEIVHTDLGSIGIALNGDGTKLALIDEKDEYVEPEKILALLLIYTKPSSLVVPFSASAVVDDAFRDLIGEGVSTDAKARYNRRIIRAEGNLESITEAVRKNDAEMGAMSDGTFIFSDVTLCPDAINTAVMLTKMSGENSLSNLLASFPDYVVLKESVYGPGNTELFGRKLAERLNSLDRKDVWEIEGGRVGMSGGWFAVSRNANDRDYIDVTAEAKDKAYAVSMMELAKDIVNDCLRSEY